MSIDDKLVTIAGNVEKVYDKGRTDAEGDFWQRFNGNENVKTTDKPARVQWQYAFCQTDFTGISIPEGLIVPDTNFERMFYAYQGTELPTGIDLSQCGKSKPEILAQNNWLFTWSERLTTIPDMGLPALGYYVSTYGYCYALKSIECMRVTATSKFSGAFTECRALENLTIEGVIGQNGFNVQWSTKLTHDSLMSIINALEDKTSDESGTSWVITLGATNLEKLTDTEKAIATERGWSLV